MNSAVVTGQIIPVIVEVRDLRKEWEGRGHHSLMAVSMVVSQ